MTNILRKCIKYSLLLTFLCFLSVPSEASVTLAWDPPTLNVDGTPCLDLAGYKIYYDTDQGESPYSGTGFIQGESPINIPISALYNPSHPEFTISGLQKDVPHYISLTAYDRNGNESQYSGAITVYDMGSSNPFIAHAGPDQVVRQSNLESGGTQVTLNGILSSGLEGSSLQYSWKQTQGEPVSLLGSDTATPFFAVTSALSGQILIFDLVISSGGNKSDPDKVLVIIEAQNSHQNSPPDPDIQASEIQGVAPFTVGFSGAGMDPDGTVLHHFWNFGDGSSSMMQNPRHTFYAAGDYQVKLAVLDDDGAIGIDEVTISVTSTSSNSTLPINSLGAAISTQDSDADGLTDQVESFYHLLPQSLDSDGDGIDDFIEWGHGITPLDSDGDGTIDALDLDSDNDGTPDSQEGVNDNDSDGAPNYIDIDDTDGPLGDQDQDGIDNSAEVTNLMNPNLPDSDGDEIDDQTEFGNQPVPLDSDGDEIIDALDTDSDNDGKPDSQEGMGDDDDDGSLNYRDSRDDDGPMGDADLDGIINSKESYFELNPNLADSDQDGISDLEEIQDVNHPMDTDKDGLLDALDSDSDNDGMSDFQESIADIDANGLLDRLDITTATFIGKRGTMAIKVATEGCRLIETKHIPDTISTTKGDQSSKSFSHGGLQFIVGNVPAGGSVDMEILLTRDFHKEATYWKYDEANGYSELASTVSGNKLLFSLTDGGIGDSDNVANTIIVDPGFIDEPIEKNSPSNFSVGGGGCRVAFVPSGIEDSFFLLLPLLFLGIINRLKRI